MKTNPIPAYLISCQPRVAAELWLALPGRPCPKDKLVSKVVRRCLKADPTVKKRVITADVAKFFKVLLRNKIIASDARGVVLTKFGRQVVQNVGADCSCAASRESLPPKPDLTGAYTVPNRAYAGLLVQVSKLQSVIESLAQSNYVDEQRTRPVSLAIKHALEQAAFLAPSSHCVTD
jgi:hypothetical protein